MPAFGVAACVQLIFSLGPFAWARFFVYTAICSVFYAVRGFTGVYLGWDGFRDEDDGTEMVGVGGGGGRGCAFGAGAGAGAAFAAVPNKYVIPSLIPASA